MPSKVGAGTSAQLAARRGAISVSSGCHPAHVPPPGARCNDFPHKPIADGADRSAFLCCPASLGDSLVEEVIVLDGPGAVASYHDVKLEILFVEPDRSSYEMLDGSPAYLHFGSPGAGAGVLACSVQTGARRRGRAISIITAATEAGRLHIFIECGSGARLKILTPNTRPTTPASPERRSRSCEPANAAAPPTAARTSINSNQCRICNEEPWSFLDG